MFATGQGGRAEYDRGRKPDRDQPIPAASGRVLTEDVVVRNRDGSVRLHHLPLAILTDKDTGHPHRPFPAARFGEPPAPLRPGDVALDMNVDVIGYRLDLLRPAGGGHG